MDVHAHPTLLLTIMVVLFVITSNNPMMIMTGDVTIGHRKIEAQCNECHTPWRGAPEEKCINCHMDLEPSLDPIFHGQDCLSCHKEHDGRLLVIGEYDHSKVNYGGTALHPEAACRDCHPNGFLYDPVPTCLECHREYTYADGPTLGELDFSMLERACIHCHSKKVVDLESIDLSKFR